MALLRPLRVISLLHLLLVLSRVAAVDFRILTCALGNEPADNVHH